MAAPINVYWSVGVDFRKFDISVPAFVFDDRGPLDFLPVIETQNGSLAFQDEIVLPPTLGGRFGDSFLGNDWLASGQTLNEGDIQIYLDRDPTTGAQRGYIQPMQLPFSVTQLNSVIDSVSTVDDIAFLRKMLAGDDVVVLSGGAGGAVTHDYVFSGNGSDTVSGFQGNDTLLGEAGGDVLNGGGGRDVLYGANGSDTLNGGDLGDRLFGGAAGDVLYGEKGDDVLSGGDGGNSYYGGDGADTIQGGNQSESIVGGNGNDRIIGSGGDDSIYGDLFGGGSGADQFTFRKNAGRDAIYDFQDGIDKIRIEAAAGTNVGTFVFSQDGSDCIITNTTLNLTIALLGVNKSQITLANDFLLIPI